MELNYAYRIKEHIKNYRLCFYVYFKEVYLIRSKGDVKISPKRAIKLVEAGVKDLDGRSEEKMLKILNSWI